MGAPGRSGQRGFARHVGWAVGAAIALALAARFAWWVATEPDFGLVVGVLWVVGFVAAYFATLDNAFVLRVAAGLWVFLLLGTVAVPLSWLAGSRVALIALIAAQGAFSFYAGRAISARRAARPEGGAGGDLVAALGRWLLLSFAALMFLLVGPLLVLLVVTLAVDLSPQAMRWLTAAWGLAAVTGFAFQSGAARWRGVPAATWIYLGVTGAMLVLDALAGPLAAGTGVQVAYTVLPGALVAAFVEVFVLDGRGR